MAQVGTETVRSASLPRGIRHVRRSWKDRTRRFQPVLPGTSPGCPAQTLAPTSPSEGAGAGG
ncbi:MAG TPA: hypothetical protein VKD72_22295, partial [Gemmataceae bacterium]|nr:hypothetical protein [Gemmataceae bacterium]